MITYTKGDATDPQVHGNKIVALVCNDAGSWGRGFVLSLSKRWKEPEESYRQWAHEQGSEDFPPMKLGEVMFVPATDEVTVANMIAQHGTSHKDDGTPPIRYGALEECLSQVAQWSYDWDHASVHVPRIGCGLAGGEWSEVEKIIERTLSNVDVYVYDFAPGGASTVEWKK